MKTAQFIKDYHNKNSLYIGDKWIWLRIHKNAGTSMYQGFLNDFCINMSQSKGIDNFKDKAKVKKWIDNMTDEKLNGYFVWTFTRNPYDRFNSMAAMFSCPPNEFAKRFDELCGKGIVFRHTRPQHLYTHHNGISQVDYYGDMDSIDRHWEEICKRCNLPQHKLKRLNTSKHGKWIEEFNQETIDFINDYYRLDFEYFNYEMI